MSVERFDDALCGVCGRQATGYGYSPDMRKKVLWVCDDDECLQIAKDSYGMKQDQFSRLESLAAQEGRRASEAFMDEIGVYDFRELTEAQACEFARRLVGGYRAALKGKLRDEAPF